MDEKKEEDYNKIYVSITKETDWQSSLYNSHSIDEITRICVVEQPLDTETEFINNKRTKICTLHVQRPVFEENASKHKYEIYILILQNYYVNIFEYDNTYEIIPEISMVIGKNEQNDIYCMLEALPEFPFVVLQLISEYTSPLPLFVEKYIRIHEEIITSYLTSHDKSTYKSLKIIKLEYSYLWSNERFEINNNIKQDNCDEESEQLNYDQFSFKFTHEITIEGNQLCLHANNQKKKIKWHGHLTLKMISINYKK